MHIDDIISMGGGQSGRMGVSAFLIVPAPGGVAIVAMPFECSGVRLRRVGVAFART